MLKATNLSACSILCALDELPEKFVALDKNKVQDWMAPELEVLANDPDYGENAKIILKCLPFVGEPPVAKTVTVTINVLCPEELSTTQVAELVDRLVAAGYAEAMDTPDDWDDPDAKLIGTLYFQDATATEMETKPVDEETRKILEAYKHGPW
jgi:hypothetical protein